MINPFKYGKIFDATITRLILALVLLLPWTITFCHRDSTGLLNQRRAVLTAGTLLTDSVGVGSVSVNRGDSITLLGAVDRTDYDVPMYWVQTDRGVRGYLPQECLADSAYVVNRSLNFTKDTVHYAANHAGDTIVVKKIAKNKNKVTEAHVRLASGKDTVLNGTPFVYLLTDSLDGYVVSTYANNMEPMSAGKFEKQCLGKKFDEVERDLTPALLVAPLKSGGLQAQYPVLIFKGGEFFRPIVDYDADSVAVGYRLPARPARTMNSWVLKYIPMYDKFCDLPMVGAIWRDGIYDRSALFVSDSFTNHWDMNGFSMKTAGMFLLFFVMVLLLIAHAVLTPMLVPWIAFGLLRFPIVYKHINNRLMYTILSIGTLVLLVGWVLATLSNYYIILTLIGIGIVYLHFRGVLSDVLHSVCPEVRCSICKTLYSTEFTERVEEGDRQYAVEEVEDVLDSVVTSVERWQTYDEVTTTYGDGSKKTSRENVKNHSKEHGYNVVGVFREEVVYIPYTNYYTCAECGAQETSHEEERKVLKRTKLREYHSYF